jgi:hypothetical protein
MKGYQGQSCAEAIRAVLTPGGVITFSDLYKKTRALGSWKDETIYQHLMACVVNLPPARRHWPGVHPFLFLREDGRYEIFDPRIHPKTLD